MKKIFLSSILLASLVLPWACSDNSTPAQPTTPPLGTNPTNTPTGTVTPATATNTFTPAAGTFTNTPTATPAVAAPPYLGEWAAAASPNGFYLDMAANTLYVSEGDDVVAQVAQFDTTTGLVVPGTAGNLLPYSVNGSSTTILLNHPLAIAFTPARFNLWLLFDQTASAGASVYTGSSYMNCDFNSGKSWGTQDFNKPQGFCTDGSFFYIADTGNKRVVEFDPFEGISPLEKHYWTGYYLYPFKTPVSVAADSTGNIWVADNGYNPPYISEFSSAGVTWVRTFPAVPNCVVNGMTIGLDASLNDVVYISDSFHHEVQEYDLSGNLLRSWTENLGPYQYSLFKPGPIAIDTSTNRIYVADQANATIEVFGP